MKTSGVGFAGGLLAAVAVLISSPVFAQDVSFMGVVKGIAHRQTGQTTVVLGSNPYQFDAFLDLPAPGSVLTASVTPAGRSAVPLADDGDGWDLFSEFSSQAALDAAYPNGNFTLNITGKNDGARSVVVLVTGDAYPSIPTLNNFSNLQNVAAGTPLTLSWLPFTGGTVTDFVQVEIRRINGEFESTVFETAGPGEPGSLNGTHTSVVVPVGTLTSGQSYTGRLLFAKIVELDTNSYGQGVPAIGAYFRETEFNLSTAGTTDTEPPQFWGSGPSSFDDEPVPRNSGVAFEFSEPMQASQSINWAGVDPAKFTYQWSDDGRVLFCLYAQQLPANAQISWQLNRTAFKDVAGNILPFAAQGDFTTASEDTSGTPDLKIAGVWKGEVFVQAPGGAPQIRGEDAFAAGAFADSTGFNTLVAGSLRLPSGETFRLEYSQGDALEIESEVNSKAEQEAIAPPGAYQLTLETVHQGTKTVNLTVPADTYPSIPELLNLAAAQAFDPALPLTLSWKPMAGGTVNDFIGMWVDPENGGQTVYETPEFQSGQGLNGTATSVTIPAGTFRAGRTYDVELEFARPTTRDTTTLPGSTLVVAFTRITHAQITAAGTVAPPQVQLSPTPDNRWLIRVTGDPGINYVLEATNHLGTGWNSLVNFQIFGDAFEWTDGFQSTQRFYRVREGF